MLILIDSSVYLSSLIKEEKYHLNSVNFFTALEKKGNFKIVVPQIVLYEVLNKIAQLSSGVNLLSIYQSFMESKEMNLFYFDSKFNQFYLDSLNKFILKTSDLLIAITALYHQCPLISWDQKLLKQADKKFDVYTPKQYLQIL
ncbi:MAG: PIN domain-containing protein [bacterium]